jgi:DNA-binding MarR family transcriptional regulator
VEINTESQNRLVVAFPQRVASAARATGPSVEAVAETTAADVAVVERSRKKWGTAADAGFQILPDVLFRCQRFLELDAIDLVILSNIMLHWWYQDDLPHPRPSVIAKRMNLSTRTIERHIEGMEKKGLITRLPSRMKRGKSVRPFDLGGLVQKLKHYAAENLKRRERGWGV